MFKYSIIETKYGFVGAVVSDKGLHMIVLPKQSEEEVKMELQEHYTEELVRDEDGLKKISGKIRDYFAGKPVTFKEKFDIMGATPFEMKVWDTVFGIPYGEVRSYDWVAKQVGT